MYCQACRAPNPDNAEYCRRCQQKLLVLSGAQGAREEVISDIEEEFSFDEHLLERISVLEEALKRTTETVEHLLAIVRKQEEGLTMTEAGLSAAHEVLERGGVVRNDEWEAVWERHRGIRLLALEKRDRFLQQRERIIALHRGEATEEFLLLLREAEQCLAVLDLDRAVEALEAAFDLDSENHELASFLGETLFNSGLAERALVFFERLLELVPDHYEGLVYAGVIRHESGDQPTAETMLHRAVELFPDRFLPNFSLGAVLACRSEVKEAAVFLRRAVAIDPAPQALYLLGRTLHELGRSTDAIRCLEDTVRANPDFEEAYHQLGLVYLDRRWKRKALEAFRQAQRLNPRKLRYRELVRYLSGPGDSPLEAVTGPAAELMARGEEALSRDEPELAHRCFVQALEAEPDHTTLLTYYALACLALDRPQDIERVVQKVVDGEPGEMLLSTAYAVWIEALRTQGRLREGNRIGRQLLREGQTNFARTIAYYEMAWNLAEMEEDLDRALDFAQRSMELAPEELEQYPLAVLGWVHYKRKEYARSVEFLNRSLQLSPSASVLTLFGMVLLASGDTEKARHALDEASTLRRCSEGVEFKMMECLRENTRNYSRVHDRPKP